MNGKVSTAIVLFKKRKKKNGKYPAKLRLTHERKQVYYSIDTKDRVYEFTSEQFDKIKAPKPRGVFKEISIEFSLIEEKAHKIIKQIGDFSFEKFKTHFSIKGTDMRNIYYYLDLRMKKWNKIHSGSRSAGTTKNQLQAYFKKYDFLDFREITVARIKGFELFLLDQNIKMSSIRNYMSVIQAVFYEAHRENIIPITAIPFGKDRYQLSSSQSVKRALKISDIEKIYKYKPIPRSHEEQSHDLWLFTYLCNGINMKDIAYLKYGDITDEYIYFVRKKTEHSTSLSKQILVPLTDDIKSIIERQGNDNKSPDNFVFPIISHDHTRKQKYYRVSWIIRKTNVNMRKIAEKLKINQHITTYTARHSFATVLKHSGASIAFISESLGHSNVGTTEVYLDSFGSDVKKEMAKLLTAF